MLQQFKFTWKPATLLACLLIPFSAAFVGCDADEDPLEEAGEQAEETAEDVQDETEDAADEVQVEADDATEE